MHALIVFKQCFIDQTKKFSEFYNEFDNLNNKISLKLRVMNETLANTNETIKNQQETIMKKVKERCEFISNDFGIFKKNMNEDNNSKQKIMNENLYEMREKIQKCEKAILGIVNIEEVESVVNEKSFLLHQTICNDVRDHQVRPAVERLMTEIKTVSE